MKSYTITVNGNVYDVTVEENGAVSAPVAAPRRAAAPVAAPAAALVSSVLAAPPQPTKDATIAVAIAKLRNFLIFIRLSSIKLFFRSNIKEYFQYFCLNYIYISIKYSVNSLSLFFSQ